MSTVVRPAGGVATPSVLKQIVAQEIRRQVFSGEMRPGTKVDQDALAEQLGVSKLPVREALIALEGEGIIQTAPRRGAFVAQLSREDIRDQYWMLGVISGLAAERSASRLDDDQLAELGRIAEQMEAGASGAEHDTLNFDFHRLINRACGSRRLVAELKLLSGAIPSGFFQSHPDMLLSSNRDHQEILDALASRSGGIARALTEAHFLRGGNHAVALLEDRGFWNR
ncbi:GntR family transcriptional regulator [Gordonia sp. NPDC003424]